MASRYVFSIKSKTKWGIDIGVSFFTAYCVGDSNALNIANACNQYLPNYAKVTVSKVLQEAGNYDIPDSGATITDVNVVSYALVASTDKNKRRTIKIPLPFILNGDTSTTPGKSELGRVLTENIVDADETALDTILSTIDSGKNIVSGGPVNE